MSPSHKNLISRDECINHHVYSFFIPLNRQTSIDGNHKKLFVSVLQGEEEINEKNEKLRSKYYHRVKLNVFCAIQSA